MKNSFTATLRTDKSLWNIIGKIGRLSMHFIRSAKREDMKSMSQIYQRTTSPLPVILHIPNIGQPYQRQILMRTHLFLEHQYFDITIQISSLPIELVLQLGLTVSTKLSI